MEPTFSIVTPTYCRPKQVARLLASLTALRYPRERWEAIVVNDGGEPVPAGIAEACKSRINLKLLDQPRTGPGGARNHGAACAGGECIAFLDDDCEAGADWLGAMASRLRDASSLLCGGRLVNRLEDNPYSEATQLLVDYLYERYSPTEYMGGFFMTNNLAMRREDFVRLGGFDPSLRFGEDRDLCHRWAVAGGKFAFAPEAVVLHAHWLDLRKFLKLHLHYGAGSGSFRAACAKDGRPKPHINSPWWYCGLLCSGFRRKAGWPGAQLSLLMGASQVATLAGMIFHKAVLPPLPGTTARSAGASQ